MKIVFRKEEGTSKFVFIQFKSGTVVALSEFQLALTFFVTIMAVFSLNEPLSPSMFISMIGAFVVMLFIDSRFRSHNTWKRPK